MYDSQKVLVPLASLTLFVILVGILTQNLFAKQIFTGLAGRLFSPNKPYVAVNDNKIYVDIADSPTEWQIGLSGRKSLKKNEGMLFIFDRPDTRPSFWMDGMNFGIDIIWINDGEITQMDLNIDPPDADTPTNELTLYTPYVAIDYVLEMNAGYVKENGIAVGDTIDLSGIRGDN